VAVALVLLYALSFVLEIAGLVLLVTDIRKDQVDLKHLLESRLESESAEAVDFGTMRVGGMMGAMFAQNALKQNVMDEYTLGKLRTGYPKRWWAVAILALGALLSATTNVLGVIAPG